MNTVKTDFRTVLHADGPDPARVEALQLYGRLVGSWEAEITAHGADGSGHEASGEIHFGWVLQGRAIQDVWMIPRLAERNTAPAFPIAGHWYGTTLRIYDPTMEAWRIYWIDPATNVFRQQIGSEGSGYRPGGHDGHRGAHPLELHQDHAGFLPLARRRQ